MYHTDQDIAIVSLFLAVQRGSGDGDAVHAILAGHQAKRDHQHKSQVCHLLRYLFVCLTVPFPHVCLPVCLPACVSVHLPVCMLAFPVRLSVCLSVELLAFLNVCYPACLSVLSPAYRSACLQPVCLSVCLFVRTSTNLSTRVLGCLSGSVYACLTFQS